MSKRDIILQAGRAISPDTLAEALEIREQCIVRMKEALDTPTLYYLLSDLSHDLDNACTWIAIFQEREARDNA